MNLLNRVFKRQDVAFPVPAGIIIYFDQNHSVFGLVAAGCNPTEAAVDHAPLVAPPRRHRHTGYRVRVLCDSDWVVAKLRVPSHEDLSAPTRGWRCLHRASR